MSEAIEILRKQHRTIAALTFGQVPQVRTIFGRQIMLYQRTSPLFMLPYQESDSLQVLDTMSAHFGEPWGLLDMDPMDTSLLP